MGGPFSNPALIDFVNTYEGGLAFPRISASGYGRLGTNNTVDEPHHNFSYQIDIVKSMQDHALKFGFQGAYRDTNQRTSEGTSGSYDFSGGFTQGPDPLLPTVNTGNGLADLILGVPRGRKPKLGLYHSHAKQVLRVVFPGRLARHAPADAELGSAVRLRATVHGPVRPLLATGSRRSKPSGGAVGSQHGGPDAQPVLREPGGEAASRRGRMAQHQRLQPRDRFGGLLQHLAEGSASPTGSRTRWSCAVAFRRRTPPAW